MKTGKLYTKDGKELVINDEVRFTCPFCGHAREFSIGFINGNEDTGTPAMLHEEPICESFLKKGPIEYMRAARHAGARPVRAASELN